MDFEEYLTLGELRKFIICFEMDFYFIGRFFNNIINSTIPSKTVIVVVGAGHCVFYSKLFSHLATRFGFVREQISINGGNCAKITKYVEAPKFGF